MFLMHRVELKVIVSNPVAPKGVKVPNAPCGVERWMWYFRVKLFGMVPNAPCGVERIL